MRARSNSQTGLLNIHVQENGLFCCDIRITRDGRLKKRYAKRFAHLEDAVEWRDAMREKLRLDPAKDR